MFGATMFGGAPVWGDWRAAPGLDAAGMRVLARAAALINSSASTSPSAAMVGTRQSIHLYIPLVRCNINAAYVRQRTVAAKKCCFTIGALFHTEDRNMFAHKMGRSSPSCQ